MDKKIESFLKETLIRKSIIDISMKEILNLFHLYITDYKSYLRHCDFISEALNSEG